MSVIQLKNISRVYGFGDALTIAIDDISLEIQKGEFVAIMGPSGSGKSTLMNIIGMLDTPSHGEYKLDSRKVSHVSQKKRARLRRDKVGFIFQSFNLLPRITAIENVSLPLTYKGISHVNRLKKAAKMLEKVDLSERQYYLPNQLSGGQIQRVAVARALVNKPSIVLADEPTGNLDSSSSIKIMELLKDIHSGGNTIIMVTHNPELAEYADRFVMLRDGKLEADTTEFDEMLKIVLHAKKRDKAKALKEIEHKESARQHDSTSNDNRKDDEEDKSESKGEKIEVKKSKTKGKKK